MPKQMLRPVFLVLALCTALFSEAQVYHPLATSALSENWSNTSLLTTANDWSGHASIRGYRGDGMALTAGTDPATVTAVGGLVLSLAPNQTAPNTYATGGVVEFEVTDPTIAIAGSGTAQAPHLMLYLNTTGRSSINLSFVAKDLDGSTDNAVQPLAVQYRVGESGDFVNIPAAYIADATSGPSMATQVTSVSFVLPAAAENQSQVQIRFITTNATGNDEWIGIDDIVVTQGTSSGGSTPPATASLKLGWMHGDNTNEVAGVYGTKLVASASNKPGARDNATTWTDAAGNLWLFGGWGIPAAGGTGYYLNDLWKFTRATKQWTWVAGNNQQGQKGSYGTMGVAGAVTTPGARTAAASWTDASGNLWLFGGYGIDAFDSIRNLNDLWKFNTSTNQWTWVRGSNAVDALPNYGTQGVASSTNDPGARAYAATWVDNSGNLWLFGGGQSLPSAPGVTRGDVWKYSTATNQWTWVGGSTTGNNFGSYGSLNVASSSNMPGARQWPNVWVKNNDVWIFGGTGYGDSSQGRLSDLWHYSLVSNQWTWLGGNKTTNATGVYGSLGVASASSNPGGRWGAASWINNSGELWLFGGYGYGSSSDGHLNDFWKYNVSSKNWTWVAGSSTTSAFGVYGTKGTASTSNNPGARERFGYWRDNNDNFWLFGGWGFSESGAGFLNDLWKVEFNADPTPTAFTVTGGGSVCSNAATGITIGLNDSELGVSYQLIRNDTALVATIIGTDTAIAFTNIKTAGIYKIRAEFSPALVWMNGSATVTVTTAVTPTITVAASATSVSIGQPVTFTATVTNEGSTPSYQWRRNGVNIGSNQATYVDSTLINNDLISCVLTSSESCKTAATVSYVVKVNVSSANSISAPGYFTWVSGDTTQVTGVYGSQGTPSSTTKPGSRAYGAGWVDNNGDFWTFGGSGVISPFIWLTSDLWKYTASTGQWTWMKGDNALGTAGIYGTMGVASATNKPSSRLPGANFKDVNGNLWFFGGVAIPGGTKADMWKYNIASNQWTWMKGDTAASYAGIWGTKGVVSSTNNPEAKYDATGCVDKDGNFWLFGGISSRGTGNDLWKFDVSSNNWTWMSGDTGVNKFGAYGSLGVSGSGNVPGSRQRAAMWADASGNIWLCGGQGYAASGSSGYLNDLWKYSPSTNQWTWVKGDSSINSAGVYQSAGSPSATGVPAARVGMTTWKDSKGDFYLFGGFGYKSGRTGSFNDIWRFSPTSQQWTWLSGSDHLNASTSYGTKGVFNSNNQPGARAYSVAAAHDTSVYLFGGLGYVNTGANVRLNDLWKLSIPVEPEEDLSGSYGVEGLFYHPTSTRTISKIKTVTKVGTDKYEVELGDLGGSNYRFQFEVNSSNNLVNWTAVGAAPAYPQSGFMSTDNPGGQVFPYTTQPGVAPFVHSTYNNRYDPATKTFYMHYGYAPGAIGEPGYSRQVYEIYRAGTQPDVTSISPTTGTYGTMITIRGSNFSGVRLAGGVRFGANVNESVVADSIAIISDTVIHAWVGAGATGKVFLHTNFSMDSIDGFTYTPVTVASDSKWQNVGAAGFTTGAVSFVTTATAATGNLHVAYIDDATKKAVVSKYNGSTWSILGAAVSDGAASHTRLAFDNVNMPIVGYADSVGNGITVKRFDGSSWITLGATAFAPLVGGTPFSMAVDGAGMPYVACFNTNIAGGFKLNVWKYNGSSWAILGNTDFANSANGSFNIAVDKSTNTPYVVFDNNTAAKEATVMKYNGSSWVNVGTSPVSSSGMYGIYYPDIVVDNTGNPIILVQEDNSFERLSAYKFDGTNWSRVGNKFFSKSHAYYGNLALNNSNTPYVLFQDGSYNKLGSVMSFSNDSGWTFTGTRGYVKGDKFQRNALAFYNNELIVAFADKDAGGKLSVMKYNAEADLSGSYAAEGIFYHPTSTRTYNKVKALTKVGTNRYQLELGDLIASNFYLQFDVDANNNLVNWSAANATPASPQSGFMTQDNPAGINFPYSTQPGATPYMHSSFNNRYDPVTKRFYLHYGYASGATSQSGYSRQVYEVLIPGVQVDVTSITPTSGTYGTKVTIKGSNLSNVDPAYGVKFGSSVADSVVIVSDTLIYAWVGNGKTGKVFVSSRYSTDSIDGFTYNPVPDVTNSGWTVLGNSGFTTNRVYYVSGAANASGEIYVGYVDGLSRRSEVVKYNGSIWQAVGSAVSDGASSHTQLTIDHTGMPVLAYVDSVNNGVTVKRFNGTGWSVMGTPGFASAVGTQPYSMAIDNAGNPYIAYFNTVVSSGYKVNVKKLSGSTWTQVGATDFVTSYDMVNIAIDKKTNTPYVVYPTYNSPQSSVVKFNGSSWVQVGSANFTTSITGTYYPDITVDTSGAPVVLFQEDDNFERLTAYTFNGSTWAAVGSKKFSRSRSYWGNVTIGQDNKPYVLYWDGSYNNQGSVMSFSSDSGWTFTGARGFASHADNFRRGSLIVVNNNPVIAYSDKLNGGKLTVAAKITTCTPSVSIVASQNNICSGTSVTFTAVATEGGTSPSYQWKKNGNNVGTDAATYTSTTLSNNDTITCELTSNAICASPKTVTSNAIVMGVINSVTPIVTISTISNSVCSGASVTFTASASFGGSNPSYQWKKNGANVGTNSTSYTTSSIANGDVFSCILTSSAICATTSRDTSNSITMTVAGSVVPSVSISTASTNVCTGTTVTFTATPVNGGTAPTYQWKKNNVQVDTGSTFTTSSIAQGDVITCVMTSNASCASTSTATSNNITMSVSATVTPAITISTPSTDVCSGSSVTFTATATNGGVAPLYQWKKNGSTVGTNGSSFTTETLQSGDLISCVLTSNASCATTSTATSDTIEMRVAALETPSVSVAASTTTICTGGSVTFTATVTNGGTNPVYQWLKNNIAVGTNSSTYTSTTFANGDKIRCVLTSNASCLTTNKDTSDIITMTVSSGVTPTISISASSTTIIPGGGVLFSSTISHGGTTPSYQWKVNGSNVGTNSSSFSSVSLNNGDQVSCELTSNASCVTSNTALSNVITITVTAPVTSASVSPSSYDFNNIATGTTATTTITFTNTGNTSVTLDSVSAAVPFSVSYTAQTVPAGGSANITVRFNPSATLIYTGTVSVYTSAGVYDVGVQGKGVTPSASWSLAKNSHAFGNVAVNSTGTTSITLTNTGSLPVKVGSIVSGNSVFTCAAAKDSLAPGESTVLSLSFTPAAIGSHNSAITINTNTSGLSVLTINVSGAGYVPATPPTLQFVSGFPYNGTSGVNPSVGQAGLYTYRIVYRSSTNMAPQNGYPKLSIDKNGDGDYLDNGEGTFFMTKMNSTRNWVNGEVYTFSYNLNLGSNYKYKFTAIDSLGNTATVNADVQSGPVVTTQTLDLGIFADDITFSKSNPAVNETFTVFARVHNKSPYNASNVNLRFYTDSLYYNQMNVPFIAANSTQTVSMNFNYNKDGFYPIKVWIDSSNVLGETNVLNNYAIRPVIVGQFTVPGAINVNSNASPQVCPSGVMFTGNAWYSGLNLAGAPPVLGATVTIEATSVTGVKTTGTTNTITNGTYSLYMSGLNCGSVYSYTVTVTDYTLTGSSSSKSFTIPCVSCGGGGGSAPGFAAGPSIPGCIINNQPFNYTIPVNNSGNATAYNNVIKVYANSVLAYTYTVDSIRSGQGVTYNSSFTLPTGTHTLSYTHSFENAAGDDDENSASNVAYVQENLADLFLSDFTQNTNVSFQLRNNNGSCVTAGASKMYIYDSIPGSAGFTLVDMVNAASVAGRSFNVLSYSFLNWTQGIHFLKLVTDGAGEVAEYNENNNTLYAMINVRPELYVTNIQASDSDVQPGDVINFTATVRNSSALAGAFHVQFRVGNTILGANKLVNSLSYNSSAIVVSDPYVVPADGCPKMIRAIADINNVVPELNEANNADSLNFGIDLVSGVPCYGLGSSCNPYVTYVGGTLDMATIVRNIGTRDAGLVNVRFRLSGSTIGTDNIAHVAAGVTQNAYVTHTFGTVGYYVIEVMPDYDNEYCEISEGNNIGQIHVRVVSDLQDLQVLSQHVSPSNLNPNPGQTVNVVASIRNIGQAISEPCLVRFKVDGVQLGVDVPINALLPGRDTTIAATATFTSMLVGPKIIEVRVDSAHVQPEMDTTNNAATRAVIFGAAPDFASSMNQKITFSPTNFNVGDTVQICNYIRNYGGAGGTGYIKFFRQTPMGRILIDSVSISLNDHDSTNVCVAWVVPSAAGKIVTEIGGVSPDEFNVMNNVDSIAYTATVGGKQQQVITFPALPIVCNEQDDFATGASSSSGLLITYTSSNPAVAVVVGGMIQVKAAGTTEITARQMGDSTFNAAPPVMRKLVVRQTVLQTISMPGIPAKSFGDPAFTVIATASSGLPVKFSSSNVNVATVDETTGLVTIKGGGSTRIIATQEGNNCFSAATASQMLTVGQIVPVITFDPLPVKTYGDASFDPGATSTAPYQILYRSSNNAIASISNSGKVVIRAAGVVSITAYQKAGTSYAEPGAVTQTLVIVKANQVIDFAALPDKVVGTTFKLKARAPGGTVTFTSSDNTIAQVMPGNNLKLKKIGTVTITAKQKGNNNYNAATATQVLNVVAGVSRAVDSVSIVTINPKANLVNSAVMLYPNPAREMLNLKLDVDKAGKVKLLISDASGRVVLEKVEEVTTGQNLLKIPTMKLMQGSYYLLVVMDDKTHKLPFLKVE